MSDKYKSIEQAEDAFEDTKNKIGYGSVTASEVIVELVHQVEYFKSQLTASNKALEEIESDKCGMYDLTSDEYGDGVVAMCEGCYRKSFIAGQALKGIFYKSSEDIEKAIQEKLDQESSDA